MRRFLGLCGALAVIMWVASALRARADAHWQSRAAGIESRNFNWRGVRIHAFRAPASRVQVATGAYLEAQAWLKQQKARVAINGGYFDGKGHSMGLRIHAKQQISPLRRADWGVFWVKNGRAQITHRRDFKNSTRPDEAVQCGPRLVVGGKVTDLKAQWSRRSGVGIDRRGRVVLAVANGPLSLRDWAQIWAKSDGLACRDALNLDGGPSTQMAVAAILSSAAKKSAGEEDVLGGWPVPDALVIR